MIYRKVVAVIVLSLFILGCKSKTEKDTTDNTTAVVNTQLSGEEILNWVSIHVDSVLERKSFSASNGMQLPYRLFSPLDKQEKLPLVVFLHGRGDRGTDNGTQTYKGTGLFANKMSLVSPNMQAKYPSYVLVPQCSDKTINEEWAKWVGNTPETPFLGLGEDGSYIMNPEPSESGAATLELIEKTIKTLNIDPDRVYLIGKSMGGFGTWEYTARRPNLFAAAVPMAGYSDPNQIETIKHIPFWIFHGGADNVNPVAGSRTMYKLLTKVNADVKYTEYEGANHGGAFQKAFSEAELIPWMFSKIKRE